jgi:hypothetical protein
MSDRLTPIAHANATLERVAAAIARCQSALEHKTKETRS